MELSDIKRLKALEQENTRRRKLLAGTMLGKVAIGVALREEYWHHKRSAPH